MNTENVREVTGLDEEQIRLLSGWLARRSQSLTHGSLPDGSRGLAAVLSDEIAQIRRAQTTLDDENLQELERIQQDFLTRSGSRLIERAVAGRIREGLGAPLRLADLKFTDDAIGVQRPRAEAARPTRDVCVDVASLALDLTLASRGDLAERLIALFASATNDFELYGVVDFYERLCALERAARSASERQARLWILVAISTRRLPLLPPMLVAVGGLVASGKSTIARFAAAHMAAPRVEADRAREHLVGEDEWRTFAPGFEDVVYEELVRRAEIVLSSGRPVVLDACFPLRRQREFARRLARARGWPFLFIECRTDQETTLERLAEREAPGSEGGWMEIYKAVARRWEPASDLPPEQSLTLDCSRPLGESKARVLERIPAAPIGHTVP